MRRNGFIARKKVSALLVVAGLLVPSVLYISALPSSAAVVMQQWRPTDLTFSSTHTYANPYQQTKIAAVFNGPNNVVLTVPGFYAGDKKWVVRFAPTAVGMWTYRTVSPDAELNAKTGTVTATPNTNGLVHGTIKVDPANRHHYIHADGSRYLQLQYEADWLGLLDFGDPSVSKAKRLIDTISANGFTEVMMNAFAYDTAWRQGKTGAADFGPTARYAWAGTNAAPNHSQMNEAYWQNYDRVIQYLYQKGITAHIFFKVYNKQVNWPAKSSADENMYVKFLTARYQAYPNIIWDFAKEVYNEKDQSYIADRLHLIGSSDAYRHLRTIHDPDAGGTNGGYLNNPLIRADVDFLTDQDERNPLAYYAHALLKRNSFNMPITNSEFSYQVGNDGGFTYPRHSSADDVLKRTLEVMMAGAYPGYYYTYHAWDVVRYAEVPNGLDRYKNLAGYLRTSTGWDTILKPDDALIGGGVPLSKHLMAAPGREYLGYLAAGGSLTLPVTGLATGAALRVQWYNINTGVVQAAGVARNGVHTFASPWRTPALLHLG